MAENKKSFLLYCDLIHTVKKLPKDKQGELFMTILEYVNDLNPKVEDLTVDLVFEPVKRQLKRDLDKWDNKQGNNSEAGKKSAGVKAWKKWLLSNPSELSLIDHQNERGNCIKCRNENNDNYMFYYWDEAIKFHDEQITLLKSNSTKSTHVEDVKSNSTKSTVIVTDTVTVNDTVTESVIDTVTDIKSKVLSEVSTSDVPLEDSEYFEIAYNLHKKIKDNILDAGGSVATIDKAKYETWVKPIRLLMSRDKVTRQQINVVARFSLTDNFWKKNILSTSKFREKFNRLILEADGKQNSKGGVSSEFLENLEARLNAD